MGVAESAFLDIPAVGREVGREGGMREGPAGEAMGRGQERETESSQVLTTVFELINLFLSFAKGKVLMNAFL